MQQEVKNYSGYIPEIDENYIQYGNFNDVLEIIKSGIFFPTWLTGNTGTGKTQMIEQACAVAGREYVRINFTKETDEGDLFGNHKLIEKNGTTVSEFQEGPVTHALRRGAILLLDEIDAGECNKVLCLQSTLEGKGVLLKIKNQFVNAAPRFNIFATSNTKGHGSDDGRFIGTSIMNDAFLDRFAAMIHQDYPDIKTEIDILSQYAVDYIWEYRGIDPKNVSPKDARILTYFIEKLCEWAEQIRKTYNNQGISEVITTRSLISIIKAYSIFDDKYKALNFACERYPNEIKDQFIQVFEKLVSEEEFNEEIYTDLLDKAEKSLYNK